MNWQATLRPPSNDVANVTPFVDLLVLQHTGTCN